ncbi:MAG: alpha/beta hydrolase, partial [Ectothiorhodospiraceae bacterium]|nr:alpha/beta hydrolase [Ectothiorhodospiraceae bacterium]
LKQCHDHLDAVPRAQVVYNRERTRGLTIELADAIGEAWVKDASVQLRDVGKGARLCVKAETKALERTAEGGYVLRNGPFLRRFLDGYYPMRVSVDVEMPVDLLRFASVSPAPQDGFKVWQDAQGVHIDSWFEGRLVTELHFLPN